MFHLFYNIVLILGAGQSDAALDLLKPENAAKIFIKIADLGNACWVVSSDSTTTVTSLKPC